MWLLFVFLAAVLIVGSALILLRTAKKPKVPFGDLIENDFINAGEPIYSKDRKHKAEVLAKADEEYQKAIDWYQKVVNGNASDPKSHYTMAIIYRDAGYFDEAREHIEIVKKEHSLVSAYWLFA